MALTRPAGDEHAPWEAVSFATMHMGFGGSAESPCNEGFAPIEPPP